MAQTFRIEVEVTATDKTASSGVGKIEASLDKFSKKMLLAEQKLAKMTGKRYEVPLELKDKLSSAARTAWNVAKNLCSKALYATVKLKDMLTAPLRKLWRTVVNPITMGLSTLGVGIGIGDAVSTFAEFGSTMSSVQALTGATTAQFAQLTAQARQLGAETSFSASEAAAGMTYLGMAGWNTEQILAAMPGMLDLAAAGGTDLATTADIISDVMTAMGDSANKAGHYADVFAVASSKSNTTVELLGESLKYAAPVANTFGMNIEEVTGALGMMANAGIKGSNAGTSLRTALLKMAAPSKEAAKMLKKMKVSFTDSDGNMKSFGTIIGDLSEGFSKLTAEQKMNYAQSIFGVEASSAMLALIEAGPDALNSLTNSLTHSKAAAKDMAETRLDNLAGDITKLQSAASEMQLALMTELDPYLRAGVQWLTEQIPSLTETLTGFIDKVVNKASAVKGAIDDMTNSDAWKNADGLWGKLTVAWDQLIVQPFDNWWNGGGNAEVTRIASDIGINMGEVLSGMILSGLQLLSGEEIDEDLLDISPMAKAGARAGSAFLKSFGKAFDINSIVKQIPKAIQNVLSDAGTLLGDNPTDTSWLSAGLTVAGISKLGSLLSGIGINLGTVKTAFEGCKAGFQMFMLLPTPLKVAAGVIAGIAGGLLIYTVAMERQEQALLHMGDSVQAAADTLRTSVANANEIENLIKERGELEAKIEIGGLSEEETSGYLDRIASIDARLMELSGGLITQYDLENGKVKEKLALLQQVADMQAEADLRELRQKNRDAEKQLPELSQKIEEEKQKMAGFEPKFQESLRNTEFLLNIKDATDTWESFDYTNENIASLLADYQGKIDQGLLDTVKNQLESGSTQGKDTAQSALGATYDAEQAKQIQLYKENQTAAQNIQAAMNSLQQVYNGILAQYEGEYNNYKSFDSTADNYADMSLEERASFLQGLQALEAYQTKNSEYFLPGMMDDISAYRTAAIESANAYTPKNEYDKTGIGLELDAQRMSYMNTLDNVTAQQKLFDEYDAALQSGNKDEISRLAQSIIDASGDRLDSNSMVEGQLKGQAYEDYQNAVWGDATTAEKGWTAYLDSLPQKIAEIDAAYAKASEKQTELGAQKQTVNSAIDTVKDLQSRYSTANIGQNSADPAEREAALAEIESIKTAYAELQAASPELKLPDVKDLSELQSVMDSLTTQRADLTTQIDDLTASMSNMDALKEQIQSIVDAGSGAFSGYIASAQGLNREIGSIPASKTTLWTLKIAISGSLPTGGADAGASLPENAEGGIYGNGGFLSWVAEDGPEAIIPLGMQRRDRGLSLWLEAGRKLGVAEMADGGIVGDTLPASAGDTLSEPNEATTPASVVVQLSMNPSFRIDGAQGDVVAQIKERFPELADELCLLIANALKEIYKNRTA